MATNVRNKPASMEPEIKSASHTDVGAKGAASDYVKRWLASPPAEKPFHAEGVPDGRESDSERRRRILRAVNDPALPCATKLCCNRARMFIRCRAVYVRRAGITANYLHHVDVERTRLADLESNFIGCCNLMNWESVTVDEKSCINLISNTPETHDTVGVQHEDRVDVVELYESAVSKSSLHSEAYSKPVYVSVQRLLHRRVQDGRIYHILVMLQHRHNAKDAILSSFADTFILSRFSKSHELD
nr:hypothetical protein CFP56_33706 [Quercus suber]